MSLFFARHFIASQFYALPRLQNSFSGKTVIVTGSNTGLGFEAARHYHKLGAELVILAVRSIEKGETARSKILLDGHGKIEVWKLDMSDNDSIIAFAKKASALPRIDILLENAGMMQHRWETNRHGLEMTMAVNFYGTILLALLMIPVLRESGKKNNSDTNLTIVTSEVHHFTGWGRKGEVLADLDDESKYDARDRYNVSKLLEILYVRELAKQLKPDRKDPILNVANPGMCESEFDRNMSSFVKQVFSVVKAILARYTAEGAKTIVWPTTAGAEGHGQYSLDSTFNEQALSRFVKSVDGQKLQKSIFDDANARLEAISPGILKKATL